MKFHAVRQYRPTISMILVVVGLFGIGSVSAFAQIEVFKYPLLVSSAQGQVFDSFGRPIPDAVVTLKQEGKPALEINTNDAERFNFKAASGQYVLRVKAQGFASAYRDIDVGRDFRNLFHSNSLWVVLRVSACTDTCSWVTTSEKKFLEIISLER